MADEKILKQWQYDGARCVIWHDAGGVVHGAAVRDHVPAITVAMPRGADIDQVTAATCATTR